MLSHIFSIHKTKKKDNLKAWPRWKHFSENHWKWLIWLSNDHSYQFIPRLIFVVWRKLTLAQTFPACVHSSGCQIFLGHIQSKLCQPDGVDEVILRGLSLPYCNEMRLIVAHRLIITDCTVIFRIFCTFQSAPLYIVSHIPLSLQHRGP